MISSKKLFSQVLGRRIAGKGLLATALLSVLAVAGVGCQSHAGNGALLGGAIGAGTGAIIGHNSHGRTASGALIGGAVGALAGGAIGDAQDRAERDRPTARYYDDDGYRYRRTETRYYDDRPPRGGYYESRSYRSYGSDGSVSTYTEYRRY